MKKLAPVVFAALCISLLCMAGCSCTVTVNDTSKGKSDPAPAPAPAAPQAQYSIDDADILVEGGAITVSMPGNPTTGYEWTCTANGDNLKIVSDNFEEPKGTEAKSGAGGLYTFVAEADGTGTTTLEFKYARSWEKSKDDAWINIEVVVKDGKITDTTATSNAGHKAESHAS